MEKFYTDEENVQVLIALLKKHEIRRVIASPGSSNSPLSASLQHDSYFEVYSSVDERSAAYMACGLASETGEPIVISCTGATASRNYLPGLTEAYYRKLPILAITSTQEISRVGHHIAQVIDRSVLPNDTANLSVTLPVIKDKEDFWDCEMKVNKAILELTRKGGGPAHINLSTNSLVTFNTKELPDVSVIKKITINDNFPELAKGKVAVFIGSHKNFSKELTKSVDDFCEVNNAVVFCDHTSSYKGKYRLQFSIVGCQQSLDITSLKPDLIIHIGEVTGDYHSIKMKGKKVWRVNEDGEIRDPFRGLRYIFEMDESYFFNMYSKEKKSKKNEYFETCKEAENRIRTKIPELPFSNVWMASKLANQLPAHSTIHFSILNSLRSWNLFSLPESVTSASNVGGFGIDGCTSSFVGASLADKNKLYFLITGDLAFFYDINVLGNRHVGNNLRILLVNNGKGGEFRLYKHHTSHFEDAADEFIAAAGHFGNKSKDLIKNFTENLGFKYLSASNKDEFNLNYEKFIDKNIIDRPVIMEVFTESDEDSNALKMIMTIEDNVKGKAKNFAREVLGKKGMQMIKKIRK